MPIGLVSGYDSDPSSDSDPEVDAGPSEPAEPSSTKPLLPSGSALASRLGLPPPCYSSPSKTSSGGLISSLPPPRASHGSDPRTAVSRTPPATGTISAKRKNQIRIESLADLSDSEDHGKDNASTSGSSLTKRQRTQMGPQNSAASSHGLFGMLPAPSRKGPPTPPRKRREEEDGEGVGEARLPLQEEEGEGQGQSGGKKGNADFRAMLGLKPSASSTPATKPKEMSVAPFSSQLKSSGTTSVSSSQIEPTKTYVPSTAAPLAPISQSSALSPTSTEVPHPMDFFSLSSSSASGHSSSSKLAASSRLVVSSAPSIEDSSPYSGWHQNPDGSWVPVTPEAIRALEAHQAAQAAPSAASGEEEMEREMRKLREQGIDVDSLQSVDLEATRAEWEKKPLEAPYGTSSTSLEAKYAAAAGLPSQTDDDNDEGPGGAVLRKRRGFEGVKIARGKGRGQLSNLIAQAAERKDELEHKWAEGKSNRAAASNRYGW